MKQEAQTAGHGCCSCGHNRREFLASVGVAAGWMALAPWQAAGETAPLPARPKDGGVVRVAFLYPPSSTFSGNPDGWWSWPGNEFDAEGRQKQYTETLRQVERDLGMRLEIPEASIANDQDAERLATELKETRPDGLLLIMFYNGSLPQADRLLAAAEEAGIPAIFDIGLGVKHGAVENYRRPGLYFIQSLDNLDAIAYGLRMIHTKKILAQSRILSVTEAEQSSETVEPFLGVSVRVIPFARYAERFGQVALDAEARAWLASFTDSATEIRGVTQEALDNAARAYLALRQLLDSEQADGVTMNCLRRGMLKPCLGFASLNGQLIPAACENDLPAVYTQALGQGLIGRPGFQHNPCYETEKNLYYASHCTCAPKLRGPNEPGLPYLLRRFAHKNEGSCAIQVFWQPGDPVTMARYYPGGEPALDGYAGKEVESLPMPPAAGCTTNVEVELTDRDDACQVHGHHNLLFRGDYARRFRLFAQLYKMRLADTGFKGTWPA